MASLVDSSRAEGAGGGTTALVDFQTCAPSARIALPTWEHYAPVLVAAGAASGGKPRVSFPVTGWWMNGAFTKRSVQFD
jgi:4,5-DOPA dioxygenase extradiol